MLEPNLSPEDNLALNSRVPRNNDEDACMLVQLLVLRQVEFDPSEAGIVSTLTEERNPLLRSGPFLHEVAKTVVRIVEPGLVFGATSRSHRQSQLTEFWSSETRERLHHPDT